MIIGKYEVTPTTKWSDVWEVKVVINGMCIMAEMTVWANELLTAYKNKDEEWLKDQMCKEEINRSDM